MSTLPYPPQRQLSVGEVLDLSFRIYRTTFVKCLLFATCGVIAGQLAGIYALIKGRNLAPGAAGMAGMGGTVRTVTLTLPPGASGTEYVPSSWISPTPIRPSW